MFKTLYTMTEFLLLGENMNMKGLNNSQVLASRQKYGANIIPMAKPRTWLSFLGDVFRDKLNLILLAMMVMFTILATFGYGSVYEPIGIAVVLFVVSIISVVTRLRSQKNTLELRRRASIVYSNVLRNGRVTRLDATELVVGDTVILAAGETVPADGYVVSGNISVDNSILNGESDECDKLPVRGYKYNPAKTITADDYTDKNSVFSGTLVQSGTAHMLVTRVGMATENAKIMSTLTDITELKTTLQIQLDNLAGQISRIGLICSAIICLVMVVVHLSAEGITGGVGLLYVVLNALTVGLTIFVAAVPEGLPFIIGLITGQNVRTMIKNNILAKNPNKIPEAGNIQLLCTDKTGTLTFGNLMAEANYDGAGNDVGFSGTDKLHDVIRAGILANSPSTRDKSGLVIGGTTTERAIFAASDIHGNIDAARSKLRIVNRSVFDSAKKFSATSVSESDGMRTYITGAPEVVLAHVDSYLGADGRIHHINHERISELMHECMSRSMRMVAMGYADCAVSGDVLPERIVLLSLVSMRDEIRPGVPGVVGRLRQSGVGVMMITGDILDTARAIARECGIMSAKKDIALTASEFDALSDAVALRKLPHIRVIARATPETKLRVVKLAQSLDLCIGMCGDGTNDAPALKRADVGFAMGNSTDVCKSASDIIITDNNFISVANSILLGRTFMHNVTNFLRFQLPINFTLVTLSMLMPILTGLDAFCAVQILLINIVMDSLNSLAFGGEPARPEYMSEPVLGKNAPLLSRNTTNYIIYNTFVCLLLFGLTFLPPVSDMFSGAETRMSANFALLIIASVFGGFVIRSTGFNIFRGLTKNLTFVIVAFGIMFGAILATQFGGAILQLQPLDLYQWLTIFGLAILIIPFNFLRVAIIRMLGAGGDKK